MKAAQFNQCPLAAALAYEVAAAIAGPQQAHLLQGAKAADGGWQRNAPGFADLADGREILSGTVVTAGQFGKQGTG